MYFSRNVSRRWRCACVYKLYRLFVSFFCFSLRVINEDILLDCSLLAFGFGRLNIEVIVAVLNYEGLKIWPKNRITFIEFLQLSKFIFSRKNLHQLLQQRFRMCLILFSSNLTNQARLNLYLLVHWLIHHSLLEYAFEDFHFAQKSSHTLHTWSCLLDRVFFDG